MPDQSLNARRLEDALRPLLGGEVKARAEAIGRPMAAEQPVTAVTDLIESGRVPDVVQ